jgi:hypothetical protein
MDPDDRLECGFADRSAKVFFREAGFPTLLLRTWEDPGALPRPTLPTAPPVLTDSAGGKGPADVSLS